MTETPPRIAVPPWRHIMRFLTGLIDPRTYAHALKLLNYYSYSHVRPKAKAAIGPGVRLSPNASLANGERIEIRAGAEIGARCHLWAGESSGRVVIGDHALLGPGVFVTAADYRFGDCDAVMAAGKDESDVEIGANTWLGADVIVVAGVKVGDGAIVGAGSVVTRDIPPYSVAVGSPARVVADRVVSDSVVADSVVAQSIDAAPPTR